MKKCTVIFIVFMLVSMLFAIPAPVQATKPEELIIEASLDLTGPDSAEGSFTTSGLFEDCGEASEVFFIDEEEGTIHGVKTLVGEFGTITLKFQAVLDWISVPPKAEGRYTIISGTGAYKKLHGVGDTYAEIIIDPLGGGTITAKYTGTGHFD